MRGRAVAINMPLCSDDCYVQINIYGTSLEGLREEGVDVKHILEHIGHRSIVMDVPIVSSSKGFRGHSSNGNDEEHDKVVKVTVKSESVEAVASITSSGNRSIDEEKRTDKNGGSFENFILGRPCDGSHAVAHLSKDRSLSIRETLASYPKSSDTAQSGTSQNVDEETLFQDCIDDFDEVKRHSISPIDPSGQISEAVEVSTAMLEDENDSPPCTTRKTTNAQGDLMPGYANEGNTAQTNPFATTTHAMEIENPDDNDETLVANLPLSHHIRRIIESNSEDVESVLNTAMICYEIEDDPERAHYLHTSDSRPTHGSRKRAFDEANLAKDFPMQEAVVATCGTHDDGHSQDECQSSLIRETGSLSITVDSPPSNVQDLNNQMAAAVSSSCLSPKMAVGFQFDHLNNAENSTAESIALSEEPNYKRAHLLTDGIDQCKFKEQDNRSSEGCGKELVYRRRYGKLRLLDHVRTHFSKAVKLCKVCDYKAPCPRSVYRHHKVKHGDLPYTGPASAETKNDMEQLLQLYKQCFPDDRVNDTDPPTGHRGVVKNYPTLEEVERSETSSSIEVSEQSPLEAPKAFSDMIFDDILCECSEICDGLEGIGSGWSCTTDLNGIPVMNEAEGRSNIIGKESPKIYTELQAPTHASLPPNRDSVVDGGHSSWIFTVPREDYHLEAGSEEIPKFNDDPNDYNCGLDPDKTTPSSEKMKDSLRRSRTQQVLEDSEKLNCKRQENDGSTSARSDNKLKSLLKAGELSTTFECRLLGCARKLKWYPRMGRNRLVDHVRTHWKRNVKKCKLCDYKSDALRNVHRHHMSEHTDKPFMGVISCETEDDLKDLQRLYVQCFPGVFSKIFQV
ncbi:unnamed protein product [Haemonchus placei]|uniref:C2H2-type domain-containing protein n=1 Tax=Haemonchus placei TaxID=6290 RepID=A0A158QKE7_HAEPC|nr:unnamed protein product [Haemonchus placei]